MSYPVDYDCDICLRKISIFIKYGYFRTFVKTKLSSPVQEHAALTFHTADYKKKKPLYMNVGERPPNTAVERNLLCGRAIITYVICYVMSNLIVNRSRI